MTAARTAAKTTTTTTNNIAVVSKYLLLYQRYTTVLWCKSDGKSGTQFTMFSGGN
jgi:hypothetical protein